MFQVHETVASIVQQVRGSYLQLIVIFVGPKMGASRFRSLTEENMAQLLNDKDSDNTIV